MSDLPLAYVFDLGWLRIGPPYIYINMDPVIVHLGPIALRWYGLMYVVAILIGLQAIRGYTKSKGIGEETVYRVLWWCIAAGVIGGRLYFVIQQPDLVQNYLMHPLNIIATWEGGMAFYGAIFLVIATLIWRARSRASQSSGSSRRRCAFRLGWPDLWPLWESHQWRYYRLSQHAPLVDGLSESG